MKGLSMFAVLALIVLLSGTHGGVAYMSCDYCKFKEVASTQSDSLDKFIVAEKAKTVMTVASNAIFIDKVKADKVITNSFVESTNQVKTYAEKEKTNSVDVAADIAFAVGMLKRFDETSRSYQLAANTLINANSSGVGSGTAGEGYEGFNRQACNTASGAIAEGDKRICESCPRSESKAEAAT